MSERYRSAALRRKKRAKEDEAVTVIGVETQLPFTSTVVFHSNLTGSRARGARG